MKRYFILVLLLSIFIFVKAGEPIKYGLVGGMNVSYLSTDGANSRIGFHIGTKAELPLPSNFFLESSLIFTMKGYKSDKFIDMNQNQTNMTLKNYYLELPIHAGYKLPVSDDWSLLFSGGGYLGLGLFGTWKTKVAGQSYSADLYKKSRKDKRFDCGLGLKVGIEFKKKIQMTAGYDWGLLNTNKHSKDSKNRNLMVSCGYIF